MRSVVRNERSKHGSGRNQERDKNGELVDRSGVERLKSLKFKGLKFKSQRSRVNSQWSIGLGIIAQNSLLIAHGSELTAQTSCGDV